ncbi:MAG: sugar transporter permease [Firmicutes bacterium]|nr:sugar transporter permease [Bacillota bacterium]
MVEPPIKRETPALPTPAGRLSWARVRRFLLDYSLILALLALMAVAANLSDVFLTPRNQLNILRQVSINGVLAIGMTFVIIVGGIELSLGGVVALTSVVIARLQNLPIPVTLLIAIAVGLLFGLVNGTITARGKVQAFVVTLGASAVAEGLALLVSDGRPIFVNNPFYQAIGNSYLWMIPMPVVILLVIAGICHLLLSRTVLGTYLYAIGGNPEAARLSGIDTDTLTTLAFGIAGLLGALGGIIMVGRITTGDPSVGSGLALDAIAAAVIGGAQLGGGVGAIPGTLGGALVIGELNNVFNILSVSPYFQMVAKGTIIVGAVWLGVRRKR